MIAYHHALDDYQYNKIQSKISKKKIKILFNELNWPFTRFYYFVQMAMIRYDKGIFDMETDHENCTIISNHKSLMCNSSRNE